MSTSRLPRLALFVALLSIAAFGQTEVTVDQVIQKSIDALGGLDKITSIQTVKMSGKAIMSGGQMQAPMTLQIKRPNSMRIEMSIQGRSMVQAFDGTTAWTINPFQGPDPQKGTDEMAKEFSENADIDGALVNYKAKGHSVELLGREDVEGTPAYKLKIAKKSGKTDYTFLDAQSFLPLKSITKTKQTGAEIEVETYPGNFKRVGGVLKPHSIEQKIGGKTMLQISADTIEINTPMDNSLFQMPEKEKPAEPPAEKKP